MYHCTHPSVPEKRIRIKFLRMCPVFTRVEACLKVKEK